MVSFHLGLCLWLGQDEVDDLADCEGGEADCGHCDNHSHVGQLASPNHVRSLAHHQKSETDASQDVERNGHRTHVKPPLLTVRIFLYYII